ncbi:hypothetical protein PRK78_005208 [Emydomyces testavorans]|uniref:ADP-ribosylglycohydrolase n=1 Tax=Emydomyces testavorans TaxID=2070801 RepID=A0AAF0IJU2_9EURO|nr:hypothetical protein PRK78_005208 [Emydomyces testavorans]
MLKLKSTADLDFLSLHPFVRTTVHDKIRGTIIGSALGDCIGLYTDKFEPGSWTDDTDHALLILLSYLHHDGEVLSPNDLAERLRIWVDQGLRALDRPPLGLGKTVGSVVLDKEYLADPPATAHRHWVKSGRHVAPNGSLMRTHPLGIICLGYSLEESFRLATAFSVVTHADPRCVVACCIATGLIRGILRGEILTENDVDGLIECAYQWVDAWVRRARVEDETFKSADAQEFEQGELLDRQEFHKHVQAQTFEELQLDDSMKMGYVYKCLGAGLLSLRIGMRRAPYETHAVDGPVGSPRVAIFENIITELTFAAGDADTNACVAGGFLGCWFGYQTLPPHWRDGMQDLGWLVQKCNGLIQVLLGSCGPASKYKGSEDPDTRPDGGKGLMNKKELEKRDSDFMMRYMMKHSEGVEQEKNRLKQEKKQKQKRWTGLFG